MDGAPYGWFLGSSSGAQRLLRGVYIQIRGGTNRTSLKARLIFLVDRVYLALLHVSFFEGGFG